jgi:hypothetical protein
MPFRVRACAVCEQARPEALGKWTLLGFFGAAPDVRIAIGNFQSAVTLCFIFMGEPFVGQIRANIRIVASSGIVVATSPPAGRQVPPAAPLTTLFMHIQTVVPGPGRYAVVLTVNGQDVFETSVSLENPTHPPLAGNLLQ